LSAVGVASGVEGAAIGAGIVVAGVDVGFGAVAGESCSAFSASFAAGSGLKSLAWFGCQSEHLISQISATNRQSL
jgi:hypothetical protein